MPCTLRNNAKLFIASRLGLHCSKVRPLPALEFSVSSSTIVRIVDLVLNLQTTSVPLKFVESHHFREKTIQSNVGFIVWHLLLLEKMHVWPSSNQACKKCSACNWEVFFVFCYSTAQGLEVRVLSPSARNEVLITRSSCYKVDGKSESMIKKLMATSVHWYTDKPVSD